MRSNPATDGSIRVHVWTGNQFLPKDISVETIRQFNDNDVSSGAELDPLVEAMIETTEGVLFVRESLDHLCARLFPYLFNPPPQRSVGQHSSALSKAESPVSRVHGSDRQS